MQFPQENKIPQEIRRISTDSLQEIEAFHNRKNRHYTQLDSGFFTSQCVEIGLGDMHIFRERTNVGMQIEASPSEEIMPFAALLTHGDRVRFCGSEASGSALIHATGENWDINYSGPLDYVTLVYTRSSLISDVEQLYDIGVPGHWLHSGLRQTDPRALQSFALGAASLMTFIEKNSYLLECPSARKQLNAQARLIVLRTLMSTEAESRPLKPFSRRRRGVERVVEYLKENAYTLPTVTDLCAVAQLSERSLEYGFRETFNTTPIRYLKTVRLNGARRDLIKASARELRVADVALVWGFLEFGRFSREYRQMFSELPSVTLRRV